jgi:hypothetical protein
MSVPEASIAVLPEASMGVLPEASINGASED